MSTEREDLPSVQSDPSQAQTFNEATENGLEFNAQGTRHHGRAPHTRATSSRRNKHRTSHYGDISNEHDKTRNHNGTRRNNRPTHTGNEYDPLLGDNRNDSSSIEEIRADMVSNNLLYILIH